MVFILKKGVYWSCKLNIKPETFLRAHNSNYMTVEVSCVRVIMISYTVESTH